MTDVADEPGNDFRLEQIRGDGYEKGRPLPIVAMWFTELVTTHWSAKARRF